MMADFDWKKIVRMVAPAAASAFGTPAMGLAVSALSNAIFGDTTHSADDVATAISSGQLNGDQIAAIRAADNEFKVQMKQLDIDLERLAMEVEQNYIRDTSDARHTFGEHENVFVLGCIILGAFGILMALVLTGCFFLMTGKVTVDPGTLAVCAGLIGTVVGYVAANAQQVVSFFYGSSKGSKDSGQAIGVALTESIKQTGVATDALAAAKTTS